MKQLIVVLDELNESLLDYLQDKSHLSESVKDDIYLSKSKSLSVVNKVKRTVMRLKHLGRDIKKSDIFTLTEKQLIEQELLQAARIIQRLKKQNLNDKDKELINNIKNEITNTVGNLTRLDLELTYILDMIA